MLIFRNIGEPKNPKVLLIPNVLFIIEKTWGEILEPKNPFRIVLFIIEKTRNFGTQKTYGISSFIYNRKKHFDKFWHIIIWLYLDN